MGMVVEGSDREMIEISPHYLLGGTWANYDGAQSGKDFKPTPPPTQNARKICQSPSRDVQAFSSEQSQCYV
jgi:hypothetical protein